MGKYIIIELDMHSFKICLYQKRTKAILLESSYNMDSLESFEQDVKEFISINKITAKKVILIIRQDKVYKKFETFPLLSKRELKMYIQHNQKEYLPTTSEEYIVDYKILRQSDYIYGMVVSIPQKLVLSYVTILNKLGLDCVCVDFYQNCISRLLGKHYKQPALIVTQHQDKYSFIHIAEGKIINIRDLFIDLPQDLPKQLSMAFGFYSGEMSRIKHLFVLCDDSLLTALLSQKHMTVMYLKEIQHALKLSSSFLSCYSFFK